MSQTIGTPAGMTTITVRPAESSDLGAIAAIYAQSVHTSTATFDLEEPPPSFWRAKLDSTAAGDHFLVAHTVVAGEEGRVLGYTYSGAFRSRPAYHRTRETSVYLAPEATGNGLGSRLYAELLSLLRHDGIHLVVAVVAQPNPASNAMHRKVGFTEMGTLNEVGYKFGAYVSTTYFQLRLG